MLRKLIPITAAVLLLPLALLAAMVAGCQNATETTEPSEQPVRAVETTEAVQGQVDAMVASYLNARRLLSEDQLEGVYEELEEIRQEAQPLADSDQAHVREHARAIIERAAVEIDSLEQARGAFKGVSAALIEMLAVIPPSDAVAEELYVAYCPMAEASWLQTTEELANPYMGQKMLGCGEVKQVIPTTEG